MHASLQHVLRQMHKGRLSNPTDAHFFGVHNLERRMMLILRVEALSVYDAVCGVERLANEAMQHRVPYSGTWPQTWQCTDRGDAQSGKVKGGQACLQKLI